MSRSQLRAMLAAALLVTASVAWARISVTMVVRSSGPSAASYPPGRNLPSDARIRLVPGDTLVLLDGRGTRTLRGPGTFAAAAPRPAGPSLGAAVGRRSRVGALRSQGERPTLPPTIWHIDVAATGTFCVAPAAPAGLWRSEASAAGELFLTPSDGGAPQRIAWAQGEAVAAWPGELPVADGAEYSVSDASGAPVARLRLRRLGEAPADLADLASALIANECEHQLDILIEATPES